MATKIDIAEERAGLEKRIAELRKLCLNEWPIMSSQVAKRREKELFEAMARVRSIDNTLARRKGGYVRSDT